MRAPPFTRENAAEMARRATASRVARRTREQELARAASPTAEDARRVRTLRQIDMLDAMIDQALAARDAEAFIPLLARKKDLWTLVQPTAGVLKPGTKRNGSRPVLVVPEEPQASPANTTTIT